MKLNLTIEGRILASVPLDASNAQNEDYLKAFRRLLIMRHHKKLVNLKKDPVFTLEQPEVKTVILPQPTCRN